MFLKAENIIAWSAAVILGLAWFALSYLKSNPRNPNSAETGSVPHAVKGIIVRITENQQNLLSWLISGYWLYAFGFRQSFSETNYVSSLNTNRMVVFFYAT
jgi:hypothetical protein